MRSSDDDLLAEAREGDQAAFHMLIDRHGPALYRLACRLVSNAEDAEDVVQETFIGALEHMQVFEHRASVKTWLTRILMRQAAGLHRKRFRRRTVALQDAVPGGGGSIADGSNPPCEDVSRALDVQRALAALSPEHREVVVLREYEGMSYQEMASVLDVPQGTVESRLYRARQALKDLLRDYLP